MVGTVKFETRIKELVENLPDLAVLVEPLLIVRRVLREQFGILHRWNKGRNSSVSTTRYCPNSRTHSGNLGR